MGPLVGAASKMYEEPKRLARLGYLQAARSPERPRNAPTNTLTQTGRRALGAWLAEPTAFPRIKNEVAVRVLGSTGRGPPLRGREPQATSGGDRRAGHDPRPGRGEAADGHDPAPRCAEAPSELARPTAARGPARVDPRGRGELGRPSTYASTAASTSESQPLQPLRSHRQRPVSRHSPAWARASGPLDPRRARIATETGSTRPTVARHAASKAAARSLAAPCR